MSKRGEDYSFEPIQDFRLPSKKHILRLANKIAQERNEHRELILKQELIDEESYCNDVIHFQDKVTFTVSPSSDLHVAPVPYSEDLAKELEDRDREFELEKHSRSDILKLLRE